MEGLLALKSTKSPDRRETVLWRQKPLTNEILKRGPRKIIDFWGALWARVKRRNGGRLKSLAISLRRANSDDMAKIKPMDLVKSMSGKICEHSDISFAKRGDTQYTVKRCNERDLEKNPYTEAELAHQAKFKSVAASTAARVKTNDPEDVAAFKAQKKYKTFRSYIWAQEWASYTAD